MDISSEYIALFTDIAKKIDFPNVEGIYLPHLADKNTESNDKQKKDEFGVVILEDGSSGAFYVSLDDTLKQLEAYLESNYSNSSGNREKPDTLSLIKNFKSTTLHERAVALGAINAVSQFIMNQAGFTAPGKDKNKTSSIGIDQAKKGERIGMIGFFSPLIERLLEKGIEILVLEKNPARVELQTGVTLTENVADLSNCDHILCTASTLINNTLDVVLSHSKQAKSFSLIGPSGSSIPDILFKHGVDAVGGYHFTDIPALKQALDNQESWGHSGYKYQLTREDYPGIETLLERIKNKDN